TCARYPIGGRSFFLAAEGAVPDRARIGIDVLCVLDVEGADSLRTESRQRQRVAGVVSADNNHHVERLAQQLNNGVLTLLSGAANRVERPEILLCVFVSTGAR